MVVSNHPDLGDDVALFDVPHHHLPVEKDRKPEAEAKLLELLDGSCELIVLARYMQIRSGDFLDESESRSSTSTIRSCRPSPAPTRIGRPRTGGVKLVGATAHYVTEELDAGPIIEQDVMRVSHRDDADALAHLGADVERLVLARAVQAHCHDRVLRHGATTVVF